MDLTGDGCSIRVLQRRHWSDFGRLGRHRRCRSSCRGHRSPRPGKQKQNQDQLIKTAERRKNGRAYPEHCGCGRAGSRGACCGISDAVRMWPCRWTAEAAQHEGTRSKACRWSSPPSRASRAGGTDTASQFSAAGSAGTVLTVSAVVICAAAPLRQGGERVMSRARVPYEIQDQAATEQSRSYLACSHSRTPPG